MIEIKLNGKYGEGKVALISDEDAYLTQWKWRADKYGYAKRTSYEDGKHVARLMHHYILPRIDERIVDHKNRNRLDNQRNNLRLVTYKENRINSANVIGARGYPYLQAYKLKKNEKWCGYIVLSRFERIYIKQKETRKEVQGEFDAYIDTLTVVKY